MITRMTRYSFILLSGETRPFLEKLQELGVVDITRSNKPVDAGSSAMFEECSKISSAISALKKTDFSKSPDAEAIAAAAKEADITGDAVQILADTRAELEKLKAGYAAAAKETERRHPWGEFDRESLARLAGEGLKVRFYSVSRKKYDPSWEEMYPVCVIDDSGSSILFVTVSGDKDYSFPVEETAPVEGDWRESQAEEERIAAGITRLEGRLLKLKDRIPELQQALKDAASRLDLYLAEASRESVADDMVTVLEGFAPSDMEEELCRELDEMDLVYVKEEAKEEDNPPIKLKNNSFVKQFEVLTGMYGMPVYSEFDPTPVLGPFFLLFFAMCMGDAGYGILLIILGLLMRRMSGSIGKMGPLVTTLGTGTFFVGIILGTFFGVSLADAAWVPEWLKKIMITGEVAGYSAQMVLALGVGVFHICLAMTIKAIGYTRRFGFVQNISTWAWLILILGIICIAALALLGVMDKEATKWAVIVLGIVSGLGIYIFNNPRRNPLINIGSGLWDTYNMATGIMGDVLSYIRLYALGLAGGMLGAAFNNLAVMLKDGIPVPGLDWIGFLLIIILGHALNLAMSCLGAFVHPLRLTFVEYFKNSGYEGRGKAYRPLGMEK